MVAFDLWQRLRGWPWQRGLLLLGIGAAIFWCRQEVPRAGTLLEGMGFAMLLLGAAILSSRLLVNRVWSFYGEISYSVYLWHLPVMLVLVPAYRELLALIGPGVPLFCVALALTLLVLTGVSWLSFRYIELPGITLGKHVLAAVTARRLSPKPARSPR
jgi:peptidoglycan/LPS O-acetylase OafA/YrhL